MSIQPRILVTSAAGHTSSVHHYDSRRSAHA
jgi:hypothetical protein